MKFLFIFLLFEIFLLIGLIVILFIHNSLFAFFSKIEKRKKEILSKYFLELFKNNAPFHMQGYPGRKSWYRPLLEVVETFDSLFKSEHYDQIKKEVGTHLLLPIARKRAGSFFWTKRNFAARTFDAFPRIEDENSIITLIKDKRFLVRCPAAQAAIKLESKKGIQEILLVMSEEIGYARFFYRDILLGGSREVFLSIIELSKDPLLRVACLDVLSAKSGGFSIPLLEQDLESDNPHLRLTALKTLRENQLSNTFRLLTEALSDSSDSIRKTAVSGLLGFPLSMTKDHLEKALNDPSWLVRVESAKVLKKQGREGTEILMRQKEKGAKEAVEYSFELE